MTRRVLIGGALGLWALAFLAVNGAAAGGTSGLYWVLLYTVPVVAGFYGLLMAWWLYACLVLRRYGFNRARAWLGWACFAYVVLGLMWQAADTTLFPYTVGWPLIGLVGFGVSLWRLRCLPQEVAPLVPCAAAVTALIQREY